MKACVIALTSVLLMLLVPSRVIAEVTDRSPNGFTIRFVVDVAVPPDTLYASLVNSVGEWWDSQHTYSGDSKNLSIVAKPGGCFCEALPGGGVEHAVVVQAQPAKLLRMRGALGPLQALGVAGALTWQFEKSALGTKMTFTQAAGGYYPGGLDKLANVVDSVLGRQVTLLKQHAEKAASRR